MQPPRPCPPPSGGEGRPELAAHGGRGPAGLRLSLYLGSRSSSYYFILGFRSKSAAICRRLKSAGKGRRLPEGAVSGARGSAARSRNTRKRGDPEPCCWLGQASSPAASSWKLPGMRDAGILLHVLGPHERLHGRGCSQRSERARGLHVPLGSAQCPFRPSERSAREEESLLVQACRAGAKPNRFEGR